MTSARQKSENAPEKSGSGPLAEETPSYHILAGERAEIPPGISCALGLVPPAPSYTLYPAQSCQIPTQSCLDSDKLRGFEEIRGQGSELRGFNNKPCGEQDPGVGGGRSRDPSEGGAGWQLLSHLNSAFLPACRENLENITGGGIGGPKSRGQSDKAGGTQHCLPLSWHWGKEPGAKSQGLGARGWG